MAGTWCTPYVKKDLEHFYRNVRYPCFCKHQHNIVCGMMCIIIYRRILLCDISFTSQPRGTNTCSIQIQTDHPSNKSKSDQDFGFNKLCKRYRNNHEHILDYDITHYIIAICCIITMDYFFICVVHSLLQCRFSLSTHRWWHAYD